MQVRQAKINHQLYTKSRRKANQNRVELAQEATLNNQYQARAALVDLKMDI